MDIFFLYLKFVCNILDVFNQEQPKIQFLAYIPLRLIRPAMNLRNILCFFNERIHAGQKRLFCLEIQSL
jgi:hypothetical protein